jgi:hypothetical protein
VGSSSWNDYFVVAAAQPAQSAAQVHLPARREEVRVFVTLFCKKKEMKKTRGGKDKHRRRNFRTSSARALLGGAGADSAVSDAGAGAGATCD